MRGIFSFDLFVNLYLFLLSFRCACCWISVFLYSSVSAPLLTHYIIQFFSLMHIPPRWLVFYYVLKSSLFFFSSAWWLTWRGQLKPVHKRPLCIWRRLDRQPAVALAATTPHRTSSTYEHRDFRSGRTLRRAFCDISRFARDKTSMVSCVSVAVHVACASLLWT